GAGDRGVDARVVNGGGCVRGRSGEMLSALTRAGDLSPLQLAFELDTSPTSAEGLLARLRTLGLRRSTRCRLTRNRAVMVSWRGEDLRVHQAFLAAPGHVHEAIVRFIEGRTRRERRQAEKVILAHAAAIGADGGAPSGRRERMR